MCRSAGAMLVLLCFLTACGGPGGGPQTWIDRPLEEDNPVPVKALTIQAHASDADGVASVEFFVDDQSINVVSVDGGRLSSALVEWTPPGPGTYIVSVEGTDNAGNTGASARTTVVVGGEQEMTAAEPKQEPEVEEQEPEVEAEEEEDVAESEPPVEPEEPGGPIAKVKQNSNCRAGTDAVFEIVAILMKGQQVPVVGKSPSSDYLVVAEPAQGRTCWIAANFVDVQGVLSQVAIIQPPPLPVVEEPPEVPPEEPPEPPPDTIDPFIVTITISPSTITSEGGGCPSKPRTSISTLSVYDEGGIASVSAAWFIGTEFGTVYYSTSDGSTYTGVFGPVNPEVADPIGTMNIHGSVVDHAGNWTPFVHSITVEACID
jgi:hypothetical protein